jgi:predicted oxidoreductase
VRAMETRATLGEVSVSRVVAGAWRLGSWGFSPAERVRWIESALERAVTTFDHADIYGDYGAEGLFGEALALHKPLRRRLELVTKCGIKLRSAQRPEHRVKHYDSSAEHIVASVEASLRALSTDHLDVLLLHRPDSLMDADEVAGAFEQLRAAGKVRAFGVSNFTPAQFELLASRTALVTNQVELSPLSLATLFDGTLEQSQRLRVRPMIWSPLAGGRLFTGDDAVAQRVREALAAIAREHDVSAATVAHAWLLRHPAQPLPIVGSRRSEALDEAVRALSLELDRQSWYEVLAAATGKNVP